MYSGIDGIRTGGTDGTSGTDGTAGDVLVVTLCPRWRCRVHVGAQMPRHKSTNTTAKIIKMTCRVIRKTPRRSWLCPTQEVSEDDGDIELESSRELSPGLDTVSGEHQLPHLGTRTGVIRRMLKLKPSNNCRA